MKRLCCTWMLSLLTLAALSRPRAGDESSRPAWTAPP